MSFCCLPLLYASSSDWRFSSTAYYLDSRSYARSIWACNFSSLLTVPILKPRFGFELRRWEGMFVKMPSALWMLKFILAFALFSEGWGT